MYKKNKSLLFIYLRDSSGQTGESRSHFIYKVRGVKENNSESFSTHRKKKKSNWLRVFFVRGPQSDPVSDVFFSWKLFFVEKK
jgi:hypothetical protein